jgi:hypothetical protein
VLAYQVELALKQGSVMLSLEAFAGAELFDTQGAFVANWTLSGARPEGLTYALPIAEEFSKIRTGQEFKYTAYAIHDTPIFTYTPIVSVDEPQTRDNGRDGYQADGSWHSERGVPNPGVSGSLGYYAAEGPWSESFPIVLDLGDDGIEANIAGSVFFDFDDDGYDERTAWAAADDAFLVIDLAADGAAGGDGRIDQAKELAFPNWLPEAERDGTSDLEALAQAFDSNVDGVLNAGDARWGEFRVWQDKNQNGVVDHDLDEMWALDGRRVNADGSLGAVIAGARQLTALTLGYRDGAAFAEAADDVLAPGAALLGTADYAWRAVDAAGLVSSDVSAAGDLALVCETQGVRETETADGVEIEIEQWDARALAKLRASSPFDRILTGAALSARSAMAAPTSSTRG